MFFHNFSEASQTEVDTEGMTALCLACLHGHLQLVQILLSRGSDLHHVDKSGQTPLHMAAFYGEPQIVSTYFLFFMKITNNCI